MTLNRTVMTQIPMRNPDTISSSGTMRTLETRKQRDLSKVIHQGKNTEAKAKEKEELETSTNTGYRPHKVSIMCFSTPNDDYT